MIEKLSKDDYSAPCGSLVEKINEIADEVNQLRPLCRMLEFSISEMNRRITYTDGIGGNIEKLKKHMEMLESRLMCEITNIRRADRNRQAYGTQEAICNKKAIEQCAHRAVCPRYEMTLVYDRPFSVCKRVVIMECSDYLPVSRVF